RASYWKPIHLWDARTGMLTDFETDFSFNITCVDYIITTCHGITFFLAPLESKVPPNSGGGYIGLMSMDAAENNFMKNQIVAVEFDTFQNSWDPSSDHVGINVNSIISVANVSLETGSMKDGRIAYARVTYDSTTNNLKVFLTYNNPVFTHSILHHTVDLSKVLPEQISVGFSASTDDTNSIHYHILSWQFNSSKSFKKKIRSVVALEGLIVALVVFGCGLGFATYFWWKKRRSSRENSNHDENVDPDLLMNNEFDNRTGPKRFSYRELVLATANFDEGGKLGEGGFGSVYKGFLGDMDVAVKKISGGSQQGKKNMNQ
ncbi:hypothetical protein MKX03_025594, partial [Papaver bracteatum]